jgi:hypothetical protein
VSSKNKLWAIRLEDLRPLDVILSRGRQKPSKTVAYLTRGEFSHASFVLSADMWFDAVPEGVGFHLAGLETIETDFGLCVELKHCDRASLLRHPVLEALSGERQSELDNEAVRYCRKLIGRHYSSYDRLVPLIRRRTRPKPSEDRKLALDGIARILDRLHSMYLAAAEPAEWSVRIWEEILCGHKTTPAHFCSELVVHIFDLLGLDVTRHSDSGSCFSPTDLSSPHRSFLAEADGVVHTARSDSPKLILFDSEAERVLAEGQRALAESSKALQELEHALRRSLGHERLKKYLRAAAIGRRNEATELAERIEKGTAALLEDGNRLLNVCLNLDDLSKSVSKRQLEDRFSHVVSKWCQTLTDRLARENPLRPSSAAALDSCSGAINELDRKGQRIATDFNEKVSSALSKVAKMHKVATHISSRVVTKLKLGAS